jgi:hypothetical protein
MVEKEQHTVLIIAGHYCVANDYAELSNLAETEINSLNIGIEQYYYYLQQGNQVKLVIWVNDIGLTTIERQQFQQNYQIPDNYADLLIKSGIESANIIIRFESRARNRASKIVRQIKRDFPELITELSADDTELVRCVDSDFCSREQAATMVLAIHDDKGLPLVIKEGGAAKCCAILATFFNELVAQFQPLKIIAVFNFVYQERIKAGYYVACTLLNFNSSLDLLFCNEDQIVKEEIYDQKI